MKTAKNHDISSMSMGGADFEACQKECGNYQGSKKYKHDKHKHDKQR